MLSRQRRAALASFFIPSFPPSLLGVITSRLPCRATTCPSSFLPSFFSACVVQYRTVRVSFYFSRSPSSLAVSSSSERCTNNFQSMDGCKERKGTIQKGKGRYKFSSSFPPPVQCSGGVVLDFSLFVSFLNLSLKARHGTARHRDVSHCNSQGTFLRNPSREIGHFDCFFSSVFLPYSCLIACLMANAIDA